MKNTLYNKIRCTVLTVAGALALGSCTDFLTLTPSDKIVAEDFWKTKDDVDQMVTGTYKHMLDGSIIERAIIWGELRSDEVMKYESYSSTSIDNIVAVNLLPSNGYNTWSAFYRVINDCNLIMAHAPEVVDLDPAFTEGDYQTVRAQMLALRALCHFYLIRTFRDIPYVTKAYENTDDMEVEGQLPPATTLQMCIDDLEEAEPYSYKFGTFGYGDWRNTGYLSRDAVDAILADVYLWRASMTNNASDYEKVLEYTQKIIDSRDEFYERYKNNYSGISQASTNPYHLYDGSRHLTQIFTNGNSFETIFELLFDGSSNANTQVQNYYFKYSSSAATPILVGTRALGTISASSPQSESNGTTSIYASKNDYRYWNSCYGVGSTTASSFEVRKMVDRGATYNTIPESGSAAKYSTSVRLYGSYEQNWIMYRLTDVLLMRAEALTQLSGADGDENIQKAYQLVNTVNLRSIASKGQADDSLRYDSYNTKAGMEMLCLQERGRELCFEGKRWYDLVRYSFRHMDGIDPTRTLYDIVEQGGSLPVLSKEDNRLAELISAGGVTKKDALSYKMKNEAYLYWPIYQSEIDKNPLLHQNPEYVESKSSQRQ